MIITLSKPILIIMLVCLALIVIWLLKKYQKMLDKEQERIIAIGTYDEDKNRNNRTFLVGKGDMRGKQDDDK